MKSLVLLSALAVFSGSYARADGFGWKGQCYTPHPDGEALVIQPWDDDAHVFIQGGFNGQMVYANEVVNVSTFDPNASVVTFGGDTSRPESKVISIVVTRAEAPGAKATAVVKLKNSQQLSMVCSSFEYAPE